MMVNWAAFTPYSAATGGLMIGIAVGLLRLGIGRVAGISGIAGGLLERDPSGGRLWRLAFLLGMLMAPVMFAVLGQGSDAISSGTSFLAFIAAGILVGFGTRLASGCTSGHGICGVSRLAPRSIAATGVFMLVGMATVFVARHVLAGGVA